MTDSLLNRLVSKNDDSSSRRTEDPELLEDFQSFGWTRGIRDRALMLELRLRSGDIISLGYAWLERAEFNPSEGIKLQFGGRTVQINGQNLNAEIKPNIRLFTGITRHRVSWIQESEFGKTPMIGKLELGIDKIHVQ